MPTGVTLVDYTERVHLLSSTSLVEFVHTSRATDCGTQGGEIVECVQLTVSRCSVSSVSHQFINPAHLLELANKVMMQVSSLVVCCSCTWLTK